MSLARVKIKAFPPILPHSYLFTFLGKWEILFWEVPTWSFLKL